MTVYVQGVGTSHFGKQPSLSAVDLAWAAVSEAIEDSGGQRFDAVFVGSVFSPSGYAQRTLSQVGVHGIPVLAFENACASGTTAFHRAVQAVETGEHDRVLVLGIEQLTRRFSGPLEPEPTDSDGGAGLALPGVYAMAASRYQAIYGLTDEQLASVSVKNHRHALENPRAQYAGRYTIDDVLSSRMIADPLTLLQCCPLSDGAAAVVVAATASASDDVRVEASALGAGGLWDHRSPNPWSFDLATRVAGDAYEQAGLGPQDIDVVEVHDAFTIGELLSVEAIGLAEQGDGGRVTLAGETSLGGRVPVNPSGGLLSRGHPLGATGVAQIAEIVWQLRGRAGGRQVDGARIGLVETMGGGVAGVDGNGCVVAILTAGTRR